jgi:tetrahydromethanopterin S-methyltransferase subunit G
MSTQSDLERHEAVCEERYLRIKERLDALDKRMDDLGKSVESFKGDVYKLLVGCATSILICLITAAVTLITHLK